MNICRMPESGEQEMGDLVRWGRCAYVMTGISATPAVPKTRR
jgi:hypothetical protein